MTIAIPALNRRAFLAGACAIPLTRPALAAGPLQYWSDYISFVGDDAQGQVYFALDTNRGRDGEDYQADHFVEAYAEGEGFLKLHGLGRYDNDGRKLEEIPSSYYFRFAGTPASGLTVKSPLNDIELEIDPLPRTLLLEPLDGFFWVGAAAARMTWGERTLQGRVLYEALFFDNWNRFTRRYEGLWDNFNGLYLRTDGNRDFYMHSHDSDTMAMRTGKLAGLATWDAPAPITDIGFKVTDSEPASDGDFRWPTAWQVDFSHGGAAYRLDARSTAKDPLWSQESGGFMMAVVEGEIRALDGSQRMAVSGWGELLI